MNAVVGFGLIAIFLAAPLGAVTGSPSFHRGDRLLTPEIAVFNHMAALGAHFEYGYKGPIGLGGDLLFTLKGNGSVVIAPDITYHFRSGDRNLDLFLGAGPSLGIDFGGDADFAVKLFGGSRFYFTSRLAAYFKLFAALSADSSLGAAFGVTFRLR